VPLVQCTPLTIRVKIARVWASTSALRDLGAERGFACYSVAERPAGHFYPGAVQDLAVVRAGDTAPEAESADEGADSRG
jgi:hypothetical protein